MKKTDVVVKQKVILNLFQDLQRLLLLLRNNLRGRYPAGRPIQYGMTPYLTSRAFTLIELLVVVLIIGILAAVALPQYNKAVMRSRFATIKNLTKSIGDAQELYHMENGHYTNNLEKLSISLPDGWNPETSTEDKKNYPWGWCRSGCYGTNGDECSAVCQNSSINMQYQVFMSFHKSGPKHRCTVLGSTLMSDVRNQICQAETGAAEPETTSGGTTGNTHWRY